MKKADRKTMLVLHVMLMFYSMSGICSKLASKESFLNVRFCVYYGLIIFLLFVYAIGWQQIIKKIPLTVAFANKAITVVWGLIWGTLFFHEKVTMTKVMGILLIVFGIIVFSQEDKEGEHE